MRVGQVPGSHGERGRELVPGASVQLATCPTLADPVHEDGFTVVDVATSVG
jgi:hypothetical protein